MVESLLNEICDDGNIIENDGCSFCEVDKYWSCKTSDPTLPSICKEICGDLFMVGSEECEDGNSVNFDGCSGECKLENGWL